ncbi:phosphoribosylanthranilate isomerase [Terrisporobacter glycolicus]|uniref:N-(5'-phosphoribosyl)anthranilate isomerase n=1 Tax=Terrisporobacter glycolicus ATCC 14880 = DSM 1288 TaxID=1121315 RepID=A0ABZ2EZA5_9FIRM|nr:phosphoribosylanthranilate isomerase [Terrisporobacter glycolicus]
MTKIKICGLFRMKDIEYVNEAKPDYIGFVFANSKRQVTLHQAMEYRKYLNKEIEVVGVFVNEDIDYIVNLLENKAIDIVQLHGGESEEYVNKLKSKIFCPIIKAVQVKSTQDIIKSRHTVADYLLLDQGKGGTGKSFDWSLIPKLEKRFFLAGGVDKTNLNKALREVNPYAVDISSGVESNGEKDREKILKIVREIRNV